MTERWVAFSRITGDNAFVQSYVNMATIVEIQEFDWGGGRIGSYLYSDVDTAQSSSRGRHSIPAREPASHFLGSNVANAAARGQARGGAGALAGTQDRAVDVRKASPEEQESSDTEARAIMTGGMGGPQGKAQGAVQGPSLTELKVKEKAGTLTDEEKKQLAAMTGGVVTDTMAGSRVKNRIVEDAKDGHKPTPNVTEGISNETQSARQAEKVNEAARQR